MTNQVSCEIEAELRAKRKENAMTEKMPELLPCPFCHQFSTVEVETYGAGRCNYLKGGCGASHPAWNTRPTATPAQELEKVREALEDSIRTHCFNKYDDDYIQGVKVGLKEALALLDKKGG